MKTNHPTKKIKDCIEPVSRKDIILSSAYLKSGLYPIIDQGQDFITGYTNNQNLVHENLGEVIIFGDHTRAVKFIDFPFAIGADGTKILKPNKDIDPKFFYYKIVSLDLESRGYARHFSKLKEIEIPLPPLSTQKQIVADLDAKFAKLSEMKRLRAEAIVDTEKIMSETLSEIFTEGREKGWEEKSFGEVLIFKTGKLDSNAMVVSGQYPFFTCAQKTYGIDSYSFDQKAVLLAGNNAAGIYSVKYFEGKFDAYQRTYIISVKDEKQIDFIFLKNYISFILNDLKNMSVGANTKFLTMKILNKILMPIPSLAEQVEIVKRLDLLSGKVREIKELQKVQMEDMKKLEKAYLSEVFEV